MFAFLQMVEISGEKTRLEHLYQLYKDFMLCIASEILHNNHDAEDAVHEAFLCIAASIEKISDPNSSKTRSLIAIITERKAIDIYRKNQRRSGEGLHEIDRNRMWLPEPGVDSLADCINQLPGRDRDAILLRYSHGYHIEEIARILGLTYAAAAKLLERAKKKLDKLCREEGLL